MPKLHFWIVAAGLLLAVSVGTACSGPRVERTLLDGDIRYFGNWRVEWVGDVGSKADTLAMAAAGVQASKYDDPGKSRAYVRDVQDLLVQDYNFSFYDNMPIEGILRIRPVGSRYSKQSMVGPASQRIDDVVSDAGTTYRPGATHGGSDRANTFYRDRVEFVQVDIFNGYTGKFIGSIYIGGGEKKVKPKHVAKAVFDAIIESRKVGQ